MKRVPTILNRVIITLMNEAIEEERERRERGTLEIRSKEEEEGVLVI